jgi:hypothetical protein
VAVAHASGVEGGAGPLLGGELDNAPAPAPRPGVGSICSQLEGLADLRRIGPTTGDLGAG